MRRNLNSIRALKTLTNNYSICDNSNFLVDATDHVVTITLPGAEYFSGKDIVIKKIDPSANNVVVVSVSPQTIDGQSQIIINQQYSAISLISDGSNWYLIKE